MPPKKRAVNEPAPLKRKAIREPTPVEPESDEPTPEQRLESIINLIYGAIDITKSGAVVKKRAPATKEELAGKLKALIEKEGVAGEDVDTTLLPEHPRTSVPLALLRTIIGHLSDGTPEGLAQAATVLVVDFLPAADLALDDGVLEIAQDFLTQAALSSDLAEEPNVIGRFLGNSSMLAAELSKRLAQSAGKARKAWSSARKKVMQWGEEKKEEILEGLSDPQSLLLAHPFPDTWVALRNYLRNVAVQIVKEVPPSADAWTNSSATSAPSGRSTRSPGRISTRARASESSALSEIDDEEEDGKSQPKDKSVIKAKTTGMKRGREPETDVEDEVPAKLAAVEADEVEEEEDQDNVLLGSRQSQINSAGWETKNPRFRSLSWAGSRPSGPTALTSSTRRSVKGQVQDAADVMTVDEEDDDL
ncbi:hypothetical protein HDU93_001432 [Gonapodya sp. JEL0774]|nr:hypothetical protein HDU93_001432 [Gonapodya sp. JEL0774]